MTFNRVIFFCYEDTKFASKVPETNEQIVQTLRKAPIRAFPYLLPESSFYLL